MNKIEERDMRKYIELNKKDNFITELHEELIRERQIINEKIKEIERLNNIINKLKKFMDEDYEYYKKYGIAEQGHAMGQIRRIKNKLQELKGDGSNEKDTNE